MKRAWILVLLSLAAWTTKAQQVETTGPERRERTALFGLPRGLAGQFALTARDFATFRDKQWEILTFAQIGAATADAGTSLYNFRHYPTFQEAGPSRWLVGVHPDAHKYILAGLLEISVEGVAGHYLRNRIPPKKWYSRFLWTLPQSISLLEHTHASFHNAGLNARCRRAGQSCD